MCQRVLMIAISARNDRGALFGARPWSQRRPSLHVTLAKLRLAQAAMAKRDTKVSELCTELGVTRQTLYRFVGPNGELRADATKLLNRKAQNVSS